MKRPVPWWVWALYAVGLPWALAMGWLWVRLGHWPAWYIYPAAVALWVVIGVVLMSERKRRRASHDVDDADSAAGD